MKRILIALILSYCFAGHLAAQPVKVASAVESGWVEGPGMALPKNAHPKYTYHITYTIILSYEKLKDVTLDTLYFGNITTSLTLNGNVRVDSLNHTLTISFSPNGPINGIPPDGGRQTERHTIATNLIVYEYKGKKYIMPIKAIMGHVVWPC